MSTRWRTGKADARPVRVEEYGTDAFRVYRAPRLAGDDAIGWFVVEEAEHGVTVWIWWAGDDEDSDQGGATSETEAIAAILSYTASRGPSDRSAPTDIVALAQRIREPLIALSDSLEKVSRGVEALNPPVAAKATQPYRPVLNVPSPFARNFPASWRANSADSEQLRASRSYWSIITSSSGRRVGTRNSLGRLMSGYLPPAGIAREDGLARARRSRERAARVAH